MGLRIFFQSYKKNIQRMFKSKAMLASIFLGPFIILLLIQSAYQTNNISMKVGIVSNDGGGPLVSTLKAQRFDVWASPDLDKCITDIKNGNLDFCIDLTNAEKTTFYVDESKISLSEMLQRVIANAMQDQSDQIRRQIAAELESGIQSSTSNINSMQQNMQSLQSASPIAMLRNLRNEIIRGTADINDAIADLQEIGREMTQVHGDTAEDLNEFSNWLIEIEMKAISQRNTLNYVEQYNRNCESRITLDENYLMNYATYDEVKAQFTSYGQCKCVDFYRPNIISIRNDLDAVISRINSAKITVSDARRRNDDFYNDIMRTISEQTAILQGKKSAAQTSTAQMDNEIYMLEQQLNSLTNSMNDLASSSGRIGELTGNLDSKIVRPINIEVKTISKKHEMIVYLFPIMYFFILSFVSLLFSGIFTFSEIHSNARQRNVLSPAGRLTIMMALFVSLLTLILVQGILLILLGKIAFMFPLSVPIFFKLMILTVIIISFYTVLGIFIGALMKSQLMVTFLIIGIAVLSLLYSQLLIPSNIMTPVAREIVSINPFSVGFEAASKVILYDVDFGVFATPLLLIFCLFIIFFIAAYKLFVYRMSEE